MSWTDKVAVEQILKLRDRFNISTFVETGVFKGVNVKIHARNFDEILACDMVDEYLEKARDRCKDCKNVKIYKKHSPEFLAEFIDKYYASERNDIVFFYLDAHFYNPALGPEEKWIVVNELKALKGFSNCVICIHDYDCEGLGHCCYDGEHLGWPLVKEHILKVSPDFYFLHKHQGVLRDLYG